MLGALIGAVGGAGLGLIKHNQDMANYNRQKQMAADVQRYSPWTGVSGMSLMPQHPGSSFGSALQGGIGGGLQGLMIGNAMGASAPAGTVGQGMNNMAGGFAESPWSQLQKMQGASPTFYG